MRYAIWIHEWGYQQNGGSRIDVHNSQTSIEAFAIKSCEINKENEKVKIWTKIFLRFYTTAWYRTPIWHVWQSLH